MADEPTFRTDLYRGTAAYYDEFRLSYPDALLDEVCERAAVSGSGALLDVACGTGQLAFPLAPRFAEVWAVDQEPDAVEHARTKAARRCVGNIRWLIGRAEDLDVDGRFELVTIGNAFHRLRRRDVATQARRWLRPGGHLALLWSNTAWIGAGEWQHVFNAVLEDWKARLGASDRIPADLATALGDAPNAAVLADAGFEAVGTGEHVEPHDWTVETLIGLTYSTSFLARPVVGDAAADFEADLRARLLAVEPSGVFHDDVSYAYELAVSP